MRAWWTTIRFPHFMAWHVDTLLRNLSCIWHAKHQISLCTCWPAPQHLSRSHCSFYSEVLHFSAGIWQLSSSQTAPFIPMRLHTKGLSCDPLWNSFKSPKEEEPQPVGCFRYCLVAAQLTSFFFTWYMIDFTEFCFVAVNNHMESIRVQFSLGYEEQLMINSSFWKCFWCYSRCGS